MTADDVVFTLRRGWTVPTAVGKRFYWYALTDNENVENSIYVSPDDPWAVVMEAQPGMASLPLWVAATDFNSILAPEAIEKYGDLTTSNWKHVVGTGPFILKDYVAGSALTWARNPNYWMHDPFFPENRLPYIDILKVLIIPDISTRMAAIRTAKIDKVYDVLWEDAESLIKTNPELKWIQFTSGAIPAIMMNNESKPFTDVRVRQALMMAVNYFRICILRSTRCLSQSRSYTAITRTRHGSFWLRLATPMALAPI
jgi:ABC-type transport system substrate-binding protein